MRNYVGYGKKKETTGQKNIMVCPTAKFGFNVLSIDLHEKNRRACETVDATKHRVVCLHIFKYIQAASSHNIMRILLTDFHKREFSHA